MLEAETFKCSKGETASNIQGNSQKIISGFPNKNTTSQKGLAGIFQTMKNKGPYPRLLYPARLSYKIDGELKSFPGKRNLKEYVSTKPPLQEMLKGLL